MIRELNLTNRQSLLGRFDAYLFMVRNVQNERKHWDVQVELHKDEIDAMGLDQKWECWVEVYKSSRVERFRLGDGRIGNPYKDRFATTFDSEVYPLLRIKLVAVEDPTHKILASRVRINPTTVDDHGKKEHLLPLRFEDLGQVPWYVREPEGTRPRLVVNSNLHRPNETVEVMVKDRMFLALVLPQALRQILRERLFCDVIDKDDIWLKFTNAKLVAIDDLDDDSSSEDRHKVIEEAIKRFCEINAMISIGNEEEVGE